MRSPIHIYNILSRNRSCELPEYQIPWVHGRISLRLFFRPMFDKKIYSFINFVKHEMILWNHVVSYGHANTYFLFKNLYMGCQNCNQLLYLRDSLKKEIDLLITRHSCHVIKIRCWRRSPIFSEVFQVEKESKLCRQSFRKYLVIILQL